MHSSTNYFDCYFMQKFSLKQFYNFWSSFSTLGYGFIIKLLIIIIFIYLFIYYLYFIFIINYKKFYRAIDIKTRLDSTVI